ncbi:MAG: hypothetical protein WAU70_01890 [Flavobacteriales bacterium]
MRSAAARLCLPAVLVLLVLPIRGQTLLWLSHYGNTTSDDDNSGFRMAMSNAGDLYCVGTFGATTFDMDGHVVTVDNESDIVLAKLDTAGHAVWAISAGGDCQPGSNAVEGAWCVHFDEATEHVLLTGLFAGDATFGSFTVGGDCFGTNMFLSAYDTDGDCLWVNSVLTGTGGSVSDVLVDPASEILWFLDFDMYALFVDTAPQTFSGEGAIIARYGSDGDLHGARRVMPHGSIYDAEWIGDDLLLAGEYLPGDSLWETPLVCVSPISDGFLAQVDTSGGLQWITTVSSDDYVGLGEVKRLPSGKIIVLGSFNGHAYFSSDTLTASSGMFSHFIAAYDPNGQLLWATPLLGQDVLLPTDLALGPDGSIYVQGATTTPFTIGSNTIGIDASSEMFVVKLDTLGNCTGALRMGRVSPYNPGSMLVNDKGLFVSFDYDSTMVVDGTTVSLSGTGAQDLFVARFDSLSGFTGIERMSVSEQLHIYANPNNGLCTIDLPQSLKASDGLVLSVYDNTGQLVQRTPFEFTDKGLRLDVRAQAKGVFQVELRDGAQRYSGSIVFE